MHGNLDLVKAQFKAFPNRGSEEKNKGTQGLLGWVEVGLDWVNDWVRSMGSGWPVR